MSAAGAIAKMALWAEPNPVVNKVHDLPRYARFLADEERHFAAWVRFFGCGDKPRDSRVGLSLLYESLTSSEYFAPYTGLYFLGGIGGVMSNIENIDSSLMLSLHVAL